MIDVREIKTAGPIQPVKMATLITTQSCLERVLAERADARRPTEV